MNALKQRRVGAFAFVVPLRNNVIMDEAGAVRPFVDQ